MITNDNDLRAFFKRACTVPMADTIQTDWVIGSEEGLSYVKHISNEGKGSECVIRLQLPRQAVENENFGFGEFIRAKIMKSINHLSYKKGYTHFHITSEIYVMGIPDGDMIFAKFVLHHG